MAGLRRKNPVASRRRVDDEGEDDAGPDAGEVEDSLSEGSVSADDDAADGSDASQVDDASNTSPKIAKAVSNGHAKVSSKETTYTKNSPLDSVRVANGVSDTDIMLNGISISNHNGVAEEVHYDDLQTMANQSTSTESSTQMDQPQETPLERRRREHEDYKKKRDADPAFVPNRGAFFMHDHRHAGPAANGFRPFGRGRGRGRGVIGGPFAPSNHIPQATEPTDAPWTHDMHEAVLEPDNRSSTSTTNPQSASDAHARGVPQAPRGPPPNRSLSTTKHIGNVQLRVFLYNMKEPITFPGVALNQYTRLPDHRPPLRRDKPVRISLPDHPPKYIFPAIERSFIFIPRAMRPNQQGFGSRNRGRSGLGSGGAFSRRTSIYGGSVYGSAYSPSIAMSRRSSLAYEVPRETIISPAGSTMSRPPIPVDSSRPVVRLPPALQQTQVPMSQIPIEIPQHSETAPIVEGLQPQTYPLPQRPTFRENRPNQIPMHQPRPQKAVSVADIESPATLSFNPPQQFQQQPFHQQVPPQINGNGYPHEPHLQPHSRNASYPSQGSTGTPLSQIPERAIHAQPFQPNPYQQQQGYYPQQYHIVPQQQGYYYQQPFNHAIAAAPPPFGQTGPQQGSYVQSTQSDASVPQPGAQNGLVAQEVNGMVYYYDASQLPPVATFSAYPTAQPYPMQQVGGVAIQHGMMTPSPDGFYYPQPPPGVVYYPQ